MSSRVLVTGGRSYADLLTVRKTLDEIDIGILIHGGAMGADSLAELYAVNEGIPQRRYYAEWNKFGKKAGPLRNQRMLDEGKPDIVVAFPGGAGTADMVRRAKKAGIPVMEIK